MSAQQDDPDKPPKFDPKDLASLVDDFERAKRDARADAPQQTPDMEASQQAQAGGGNGGQQEVVAALDRLSEIMHDVKATLMDLQGTVSRALEGT